MPDKFSEAFIQAEEDIACDHYEDQGVLHACDHILDGEPALGEPDREQDAFKLHIGIYIIEEQGNREDKCGRSHHEHQDREDGPFSAALPLVAADGFLGCVHDDQIPDTTGGSSLSAENPLYGVLQ